MASELKRNCVALGKRIFINQPKSNPVLSFSHSAGHVKLS